jgi:hypothetical protein
MTIDSEFFTGAILMALLIIIILIYRIMTGNLPRRDGELNRIAELEAKINYLQDEDIRKGQIIAQLQKDLAEAREHIRNLEGQLGIYRSALGGMRPTEQASIQGNKLREALTVLFSDGELRDLTSDLGVDYDTLEGSTKGDKARELVAWFQRHDNELHLIEEVRRLRPKAKL